MAKKNHKMLLYGGIAFVAILVLWKMGYLSKITGMFGKKTAAAAPPLPVQKSIPPYTSPYVNAPSMTKANPALSYRPRCSACSGDVSVI